VLSRLLLRTDQTAIPDDYQLSLGMSPTRANAPPAPVTWHGVKTDKVVVGTVALQPAHAGLALAELPPDMLPIHGVSGGGLELLAVRPPSAEIAPGARVRLGLLWRALEDGPSARRFTVKLVHEGGDVVQQTPLPLLGGRLEPSALRAGAVVRDEAAFDLGARAAGTLTLQIALDSGSAPAAVAAITVAGRQHVLDTTAAPPRAVFGGQMALLRFKLEPAQAKAGAKVSVQLKWRAEAEMERSYKVFVHLLDPSLQQVLAQRDAQPLDGNAPTPGWLASEVVDDELVLSLPANLAAGDYPIELGVYDERSGDRLLLPNGDSRVVLDTRLAVR
jgi:hypothetical protein